jgi:uncharacterized coiled-coil DUF342 family protein
MVDQARQLIVKQVQRVRRRLLLQVLVESLLIAAALGFLLTTLWFLTRPFAFTWTGDTVRWSVPAALICVSLVGGAVLGWLRRPNLVASSLALDEKFELKERVTTFLTLSPEQLQTTAGQALVRDVTAHLEKLEVASAFPLQLPWQKYAIPAGALALALLACVLDPVLGNLKFAPRILADQPKNNAVIDTTKVQEELEKLKQNVAKRNEEALPKSEELKALEQEFEKLINQPLEKSGEKIRERIDEMRKLEDRMKQRLDNVREKRENVEAFKKHLKQLALDKSDPLKEGAAKDLEDALMKGDFEKAKAALDKLAKDLQNEKLDPMQQKELAEQFKKLQERMQKLADKGNLKDKLMKDFKDGKINEEQLERELDALRQLTELTDIIGDLEDGLAMGKGKEAGEKLGEMMKRFGEIELTDQEIRDILRDQEELGNAMRALLDALDMDGDDGGGRPGRRRPIDPNDPNSKISPERSRAELNPKGQQRITGYARGGNFNKVPAKEVGGAFRQAAQEGPEALDRQRIPDDAADIARDYFRRLGNQK